MRAVKDNREYTLTTDIEKRLYQKRGFDIFDDEGKLIAYGAGRTVPLEEHLKLKEENEKLKEENEKLKKEIAKLRKGAEK
ncbi:MAG: hypothetical protein IIU14_07940 [Ruminococcus sp.]|nr:hypothetical protein [Ruminococcus sp.]